MIAFTAISAPIAALVLLLGASNARAGADPSASPAPSSCHSNDAQARLESGMALQRELETQQALAEYDRCLAIEPACVSCLYEKGWSLWKLGRWEDVIATWGQVLKMQPGHPEATQFLPAAKENLQAIKAHASPTFRSGVELGAHSIPEGAPVSMIFSSRRQSYNPKPESPLDHFDGAIHSPKSVRFSTDGKRV